MPRVDLVDLLNTITPKGIEFHLTDMGDDGVIRKSSFTGPNTNLNKRLENYDSETGTFDAVNTPPINALDAAALIHDVAYTSKDLSVRHEADQVLIDAATRIINSDAPSMQRRNAAIVALIMRAKLAIGGNLHGSVGGKFELSSSNYAYQNNPYLGKTNPSSLTGVLTSLVGVAGAIGIPALLGYLATRDKDN